MSDDARLSIFTEYDIERRNQERYKAMGRFLYTCADRDAGHGECFAILLEEIGEVAQAISTRVHDSDFAMLARRMASLGEVARGILNAKRLSNDPNQGIDHRPDRDARKELVQSAAVITAWLEGFQEKIY